MSFRPEPAHRHGQPARTAVLLVNLGTPQAPSASAVRRYLAEFLWDPRVVEIPRLPWWLLLHGVILRTRPARSAAKYAGVWTDQGSPLLSGSQRVAAALQQRLDVAGQALEVALAMRYGEPSLPHVLDQLKAKGVDRVLVLPLYPQYAAATTGSAFDAVALWGQRVRRLPELRFVNRYADDPGYIEALALGVERHWRAHGRPGKLVMSFHGIPARCLELGDPYHCECLLTARLLAHRLGLAVQDHEVTFQSRLGRARWLEPYTEPTLRRLAGQGVGRVDVLCPGFSVDCLETLEEIAQEGRDAFLHSGGREFHYIPCLNDDPAWIDALERLALRHLQGWPLNLEAHEELQRRAAAARARGAAD